MNGEVGLISDIEGRMLAIGFIMLVFAFAAGMIWFQITLTRKANRAAGLILPGTSFCISLIASIVAIAFTAATGTEAPGPTNTAAVFQSALYIFLIYNVPTVILFVVYILFRRRRGDAAPPRKRT